ncbi:MAG: geranylgeranylglyceryl/heptaprenylglyceryl phosphate synthase [Ignavibacteriaceae bacterium]|nr:geranylgeranylglyceryl/heptaprenylglyceryl phosphate synthase [Ignavibacteriaceae bacterium]
MSIYNHLLTVIGKRGAAYLILIDPDKLHEDKLAAFTAQCEAAGVDGFLIGGSLLIHDNVEGYVRKLKELTGIPVIIFPGAINQVVKTADALLYISIISGRNAEHLIGKHVIAAPLIKMSGIEPISCGYMLIESGVRTTAEYISGSMPIPRRKPEIAAATALAAEYMGMKLVYLEAGSGADNHVPFEMVQMVSKMITVPLIVGGGIRNAATAAEMVKAGAKIVVTGNHFENEENWQLIKEFSAAVHTKESIII